MADMHCRQTKLIPMPTAERLFKEQGKAFVRELPESEYFNIILVVTDLFTKVKHYIAAKTSWTAEDVVNLCINDIWRL